MLYFRRKRNQLKSRGFDTIFYSFLIENHSATFTYVKQQRNRRLLSELYDVRNTICIEVPELKNLRQQPESVLYYV